MLGLSLLAVASGCSALDIPVQSRFDSNIQTTRYNAQDVVELTAYPGYVTHVVFDSDEKILKVMSGFLGAWETSSEGNNLFIKARSVTGKSVDAEGKEVKTEVKPTPAKWQTNLVVVTNKRYYTFLLKLGAGTAGERQNTYRLTFSYPEEIARRAAEAKARAQADESRQVKENAAARNWDYAMQVGKDSRDIAPVAAWDNGVFTFLKFAKKSEIPAVFYVAPDGQETLTNTHVEPEQNLVVIHRLGRQFVLRLDKAVVGVLNQGFDKTVSAHGMQFASTEKGALHE